MNLTNFLKQTDALTAQCSTEQLIAFIHEIGRGFPEHRREDFLEGEQPALFRLKLPRGRYCLLIISGDGEESSYTSFLLPGHGTQTDTGILPAGRYGSVPLPFILPRDGDVLLQISSKPGYRWKLNAIFVNKEGGL